MKSATNTLPAQYRAHAATLITVARCHAKIGQQAYAREQLAQARQFIKRAQGRLA